MSGWIIFWAIITMAFCYVIFLPSCMSMQEEAYESAWDAMERMNKEGSK